MKKRLVTFLFLIPLVLASVQAFNVTNCTTISSSDVYELNTSIDLGITNWTACLDVQAHNVVIDCKGYTITFGGNETNAVLTDGYDNLTVKDCLIQHNTTDSNLTRPIRILNSDNVTLTNLTVNYQGDESGFGPQPG